MRIGMLLERQFPFDERVEKEALSLIAGGHKVYILSFDHDLGKTKENYKGIEVLRFPLGRNAYRKLSPLYRILPYYRRLWLKHAKAMAGEYQIDVLHVHDLPLAGVGSAIKKRFGCRLVLDQHELWSETVKHYRHYNTLAGRIVRFLSNWKAYEKKQFSYADAVVTVEEPIREWYIEKTGTAAEKIIVIPNTPSRSDIERIRLPEKSEIKEFVLFYAGKIDRNRYLDTVIRALPVLKEEIPGLVFRVAGNIARGCDPRQTAKRLGVEKQLSYLGNLSFDEMIREMHLADICISLLPTFSEELNRTIVTKVYQYLQLAKPMIVSRSHYMRTFVETQGLGLSVDETRPESLAEAVREMYAHPEKMREYSANSQHIRGLYTWENTVMPLLELYRSFEQ